CRPIGPAGRRPDGIPAAHPPGWGPRRLGTVTSVSVLVNRVRAPSGGTVDAAGPERGRELRRHGFPLLVRLRGSTALHGLRDVGEPGGLPSRHADHVVEEPAGGVGRVEDLCRRAPALRGTLLEEAERVAV